MGNPARRSIPRRLGRAVAASAILVLWAVGVRSSALGVRSSALGVSGAQAPQSQERGVELLHVDFAVVSSSDGTPVTDLKAEEVAVRVGGRNREIRSLQMIEAAGDIDSGVVESLPQPFGTNTATEAGRTFALVIADDSFRPGREAPLRDAVNLFLGRLTSRDRVSLVTMPYGGIKVPLTTDHSKIQTELVKIVGRAPAEQTGSNLACETRRTLESLVGYLQVLGVRNEPATVLFITAAMAAPRRDAPAMMAPGMCELTREMYDQVAVAAGAARAHFYVIQPMDLINTNAAVTRENVAGVGYSGSDNPIEGIENLAGVTRGKLLQLTGSAETALGRVARETAAHYLAAITPERNDRSGRSQELDVKVKRSGVEVRTRNHITFGKPEPAFGRVTDPSPREMLSTTAVFRDLPLRGAGFAAFGGAEGDSVSIVTLVEPVQPDVKITSLLAAIFNDEGRSVSHWAATAEEMQRSPIIGAMPAQPGSYRLRVAAIDATGRAGTIDYSVNAESVRTGPLKLSSLLLGLSRGGTFVPKLQFTTEPVAIGYLEMYGAAAGAKVTATLEVAGSLNGPALMPPVRLAIEAAGKDRYVAKGAVPIGALPPGDYSVRAIIGLEGHPMTRVVQTLRKAMVVR